MKKLTLDETWRLCISMWRWIAKKKREGTREDAGWLKTVWLQKHKFGDTFVVYNCFFCDYDVDHKCGCKSCPGTKVDKEFYCQNLSYHWHYKPITFYNKLVSLNRKRKKK